MTVPQRRREEHPAFTGRVFVFTLLLADIFGTLFRIDLPFKKSTKTKNSGRKISDPKTPLVTGEISPIGVARRSLQTTVCYRYLNSPALETIKSLNQNLRFAT